MSFHNPQPVQGQRNSLSRDELFTLEDVVLPTARRWVRDIPGLADHGKKTLDYWGEPIPGQRMGGET